MPIMEEEDARAAARAHDMDTDYSLDESSSHVDAICNLFLRCTHQDQLALIQLLPHLITRDFIAYLHTPLTARILSFLPLADVLKCLRVSKTWRQTVQECEPFWLDVCSSVGVTSNILQKKRYGNLMSYTLRAWRHADRVHRMFSSNGYVLTVESKHLIHSEAARAYSGGRAQRRQYETSYAGSGNVLCLGKGVGADALLLHVTLPGTTMYTERGLRVCSGWQVTWSFVSKNSKYITFSTSDARWGRLEKGSSEAEYKSLCFWNDTTPVSIGEARIAGCARCSLIVEVDKTAVAENVWSYRAIELDPTKRVVTQTHSVVSPIIPIRTENYVHLESIALLPHPSSKTGASRGKCHEHHLLLQLGTAIAVLRLPPNHTDPEHISLLCPYNDTSTVTSVLQIGHKFSVSSDFSLLSLCTTNTLHVWSLIQMDLVSTVTVPVRYGSPFKWRCLAVGHLFSLLHNDTKAIIVCTHAGHVIQEFCPPANTFSQQDMYCLTSPAEENWLNTISCDLKRIILPMVKGGWYDPELSIVISLS